MTSDELVTELARIMRDAIREVDERPLPPRRHKCTRELASVSGGRLYERCACGGWRLDEHPWHDRNSYRKSHA
jgi:hypothetical protein